MSLVDCFCELFAYILHVMHKPEQEQMKSEDVHDHCLELVESARQCGLENGYEQARFDDGLFAVVVWIDETILCSRVPFRHEWANQLLQRQLFDTTNGGDEFYDRLDGIDPGDKILLEVFAYCFALGFHGQLYAEPDAADEKRIELLSVMNPDFAPTQTGKLLPALEKRRNELLSKKNDGEEESEDKGKLFPIGYSGSVVETGTARPQWQFLQIAAVCAIPMLLLAAGYYYCYYHLSVLLRGVL